MFGEQKYDDKFVWGAAFITALGNGLVNGEKNEIFEFCNETMLCFCSRLVEYIYFFLLEWVGIVIEKSSLC